MRLLSLAAITGLAVAQPVLAQTTPRTAATVANAPVTQTAPSIAYPTALSDADPGPGPAGIPAVERVACATQPANVSRFWASADYLLWWQKSPTTPPLIVAVPGASVQNVGGVLPAGSQTIFPNDERLSFGAFNGVRVSVGFYLNQNWGIEASGFALEEKNLSGSGSGDGSLASTGIALPYTQAGTGTQIALFTNLPGVYAGGTTATADTRVWMGEVNARLDWYRFYCDRCDLLAGFRYINLEDNLSLNSTSTFPDGSVTTLSDSFSTRNKFYGGQVGFRSAWHLQRLSADLAMKWGIGWVHQEVVTSGSNSFAIPGGIADVQAGGLYAQGANLGVFERDKFAFNYEVAFNLGYNITPRVRAQVGYTMNYLSSVARAGSMIDPVVNDAQVRFIAPPVGPSPEARPAFDWSRTSEYWLQGVNFGLSVGY
jgi:hypothetical protein